MIGKMLWVVAALYTQICFFFSYIFCWKNNQHHLSEFTSRLLQYCCCTEQQWNPWKWIGCHWHGVDGHVISAVSDLLQERINIHDSFGQTGHMHVWNLDQHCSEKSFQICLLYWCIHYQQMQCPHKRQICDVQFCCSYNIKHCRNSLICNIRRYYDPLPAFGQIAFSVQWVSSFFFHSVHILYSSGRGHCNICTCAQERVEAVLTFLKRWFQSELFNFSSLSSLEFHLIISAQGNAAGQSMACCSLLWLRFYCKNVFYNSHCAGMINHTHPRRQVEWPLTPYF